MLHLVTGVPGATKTAFVVTKLDALEKTNKVNLVKNIEIYNHNKPLIEKFAEDFTYREYEVGSGHELKNQIDILPNDYFDFLGQEFDDLRPDFYYQRVVHFNEIITRINERDGEQSFKPFLPVRTIYTNINNLKIDYARALTYDWRECPDGSLIVIDEVQLVEPYSDLKTKDNPIIQNLTVHRHRGFDFYFITQFPTLLHPTVKVLIGVHYHLTRPYGMKTVVYQYGSAKDQPNALVNKMNRETKFFFNPQQRIFKLYKSTTINTHQKRFPKGIWFFVAWVVLAIAFFIYNIMFSEFNTKAFDDEVKIQETATQTPTDQLTKIVDSAMNPQSNQPQTDQQPQRIYPDQPQNQPNPLYQKYLQPYTVEINNDPVLIPTSIIAMGKNCKAYNKYGDLLNIPQNQCLEMLSDYGKTPKFRDDYQNSGVSMTYTQQPKNAHTNDVQTEQSDESMNENPS